MKTADKLPSPTRPYIKIITVNVRDVSHMEEHHLPIEDVGIAKSYVSDNQNRYEICNVFVMHPELLSLEDKTRLEMNGVRYY